MIKLFDDFNKEKEIHSICNMYNINNYTINSDYSIDVNGDVNLVGFSLKKSPIKFNNVSGSFFISTNKLTTLKDCPKHIGRDFYIQQNELTNLNYSPEFVGGKFRCDGNELTSLEGCTKNIYGVFDCSYNKLTNLIGGPINNIEAYYCNGNKLTSLEGCPNEVGNICGSDNNLTSLKYAPIVSDLAEFYENPLPDEIKSFLYRAPLILKYQEEYGIWNSDGTFNKGRWDLFIHDVNNELDVK